MNLWTKYLIALRVISMDSVIWAMENRRKAIMANWAPVPRVAVPHSPVVRSQSSRGLIHPTAVVTGPRIAINV